MKIETNFQGQILDFYVGAGVITLLRFRPRSFTDAMIDLHRLVSLLLYNHYIDSQCAFI